MNTSLATSQQGALSIAPAAASQNAARIYLASLDSEKSRSTMAQALGVIAHIAMHGDVPASDMTGMSREQRKASAADLRSLVDIMPWHDISAEHARAIAARLRGHYDARSYNKSIAALRGTLRAAIGLVRDAGRRARAEAASTEDMMRLAVLSQDRQDTLADAIGVLKSVNVASKGSDQATGRMLTLGETMALIATCQDGTNAGVRDAALLGLGIVCGLRRAELAAVDFADFDSSNGALTVQRGKGNKRRVVYVTNGARAALGDWLEVRGSQPGPLFVSIKKGDTLTGRRLTPQGVYTILATRAAAAGVTRFSPHDLRRTYVSTLLDNGADLVTVQKLAGHASVSTTAGYDRRGERAKQDAAKTLHFPYQRKAAQDAARRV